MTTDELCYHLLDTDQFVISQIKIENDKIMLAVESTACKAICPRCNMESTEVHSTYMRHPIDLAWSEVAVILHLKLKRFFCQNDSCSKRTFAERFPGFVSPYARRTQRVIERQRQVGMNVCAKTAESLLNCEYIGISDTTINRILRDLPDPEKHPVRVLGVDDWAKRKGQTYGTILVDLEHGQSVDLLNDRTADTLAEWLKKHPEIEIVSRDRSQTYADAITAGSPDAVQVADRWHLLKNLSDAVFKLLQQEYSAIKKQLERMVKQEPKIIHEADVPDKTEQLTPAEERRKDRIAQAQQLHNQGWTQKSIAHKLNTHPKTVRRYLQSPLPQSRKSRTGGLLVKFKPYLLKRWNEGCHNATQLFREIKPQGYAGEVTMVRKFTQQLRKASGLPPKVRNQPGLPLESDPTQQLPSLRSLSWFIMKREEKRTQKEEEILTQISVGQTKIATTISLARTFAAIIRQQQPEELVSWLEKANKSGYRTWQNFAAGIQQDHQAVHAALTYSWSNGPTEGHVNRLKYLKRMMYGRAKEDLLRKRVLWHGRWSFT